LGDLEPPDAEQGDPVQAIELGRRANHAGDVGEHADPRAVTPDSADRVEYLPRARRPGPEHHPVDIALGHQRSHALGQRDLARFAAVRIALAGGDPADQLGLDRRTGG
jgi:hypothetical protein